MWKHYKDEAPFLGGIFAWTAFDYRGETTPWNWPAVISQYGAMDLCGFEKDAFYFWQSCWLDKPMVHMLPHWNHPGKEGTMIQIDAYRNCEEVELFINGVSHGKKAHTKGLINSWNVSYEPGNAKIVAYNNGGIAAEDEVTTVGDPYAIRLSLMHKGEREVLIKAEIIDESGYTCPTSDNEINFSIISDDCNEDKFRILGTANGNPSNHDLPNKSSIKAFNGLAQVIIASDQPVSNLENQVPGVTLAAISEGLICGSIKIFSH